jgi:hypothetical protein
MRAEDVKNVIAELVKKRDYLNLFKMVAAIDSYEPELKFPAIKAVSVMYPVLAKIAHEGENVDAVAGFYSVYTRDCGSVEFAFWHAMTWLNTEYINSIGCECGKEVNLFSDTAETNYNHHAHKIYREWAYKHLPEARREELILPIEELM